VTFSVARIAIEREEGMFSLLRFNASGECVADTAHFSLAEAKAQATFEYELIEEQDA
jgi:hypothetical protein